MSKKKQQHYSMVEYQFIGYTPRIYQFFTAEPGVVRSFESAADVPNDGLWLPVTPPAVSPATTVSQEIADLEEEGFTVTPPQESTN